MGAWLKYFNSSGFAFGPLSKQRKHLPSVCLPFQYTGPLQSIHVFYNTLNILGELKTGLLESWHYYQFTYNGTDPTIIDGELLLCGLSVCTVHRYSTLKICGTANWAAITVEKG